MNQAMPKKCPSCGGDMRVQMLRCPHCATEVQGDFILSRLALLSGEQLDFLQTFIRLRGNLKDVGAEVGISYPTARNRLDNLIAALGFDEQENAQAQRLHILQQLKAGDISAEEALAQLQGGKSNE